MEWTGLNELREKFLSFFQQHGHYRMESFPLIPQDDKSLLLINSGMAPLKKYFLGQDHVPGNRATTCQKCIRTPDIERVGKTARHGTYFEMLGNFSFGDYFKHEATAWAWEFVTKVLELPVDRLYVSVYEEDDEAYDIWTREVGVAPDHMVRLGKEDNFWGIGSGPCGPCSEIYFDRGPEYGCGRPSCFVGCDCDRYVEFWNLVFTQFISDGNGHYERMEHGNIDTGMGLERLACIMQGVDNLFEVDTVRNIMKKIEQITGVQYKKDEATDVSLRVITDHIRSTVFMVGDGIGPSNEGRGYVLRRLLRRAARHGRLLGVTRPFLFEVCDTVIEENVSAYPYLAEPRDYIGRVIKAEEERFAKTIEQGFEMLEEHLAAMREKGETVLSGADAFKLNDTFGFPLDLTVDIVSEQGFKVDEEEFHRLMDVQKKRAREDAKSRDVSWEDDLFSDVKLPDFRFLGYDALCCEAELVAMAVEGQRVDSASQGDRVALVLSETPFYAESGGQVGDTGRITFGPAVVAVEDCRKTPEGYYLHIGRVESGSISVGDRVTAQVDEDVRRATMRNHTAAHLLQAALRQVLGDHVHQAGSYVDRDRVRFDFTHFEAVKPEELRQVEDIVNSNILSAIPVTTKSMPIDEAKTMGAMALFGEKYGDIVRVVNVEGCSVEFCGGTHVSNTSHLGLFKIISESSVAAGVRRIEGTTGMGVIAHLYDQEKLLAEASAPFKITSFQELPARAAQAVASIREKDREIEKLAAKIASGALDGIIAGATEVKGLKVFSGQVEAQADALRSMADDLRGRSQNAVVVLAGVTGGKGTLVAACGPKALEAGLKAGAVVKEFASRCGGSGGGKPDMAMAGAKELDKLPSVLSQAAGIIESMLA